MMSASISDLSQSFSIECFDCALFFLLCIMSYFFLKLSSCVVAIVFMCGNGISILLFFLLNL